MLTLLTPRRGSRSGALLAQAMGIPKLTSHRLDLLKPSKDNLVINWGNSEPPPQVLGCTLINEPGAIKTAVNKLTALKAMQESPSVLVPAHTDNEDTAYSWVRAGHTVVARHVLTGSGGEGIQLLSSVDDFPCDAPLFTLYVPKKSEWRLHVLGGEVFDVQRKMRRKDVPDDKVNWKIRNHNNGFIFARNEGDAIDPHLYEQMMRVSIAAIKALKLDFGAVDVICNEKQKLAYVLEVNTAPGLEGSTLVNYAEAFAEYCYRRTRKSNLQKQYRTTKKVAIPAPPNLGLDDVVKGNNEAFQKLVDFMVRDG